MLSGKIYELRLHNHTYEDDTNEHSENVTVKMFEGTSTVRCLLTIAGPEHSAYCSLMWSGFWTPFLRIWRFTDGVWRNRTSAETVQRVSGRR